MAFFLLLLLLIILNKMGFCGPGEFNSRYIDKDTTTSINGIFVVLIVFSHYVQYMDNVSAVDIPYYLMRIHLRQLVVVPFLFYTGYGMMESLKRKGGGYIKALPGKFFKLLFRFDAAVMLYWIVGTALGKTYRIKRILLTMIGLRSLGNSGWYIFDILALYLLMYIAFSIDERFSRRENRVLGAAALSVLVIGFVYLLMKINMPTRYYNTLFAACVGCWYSLIRSKTDKIIMKNDLIYYSVTALIIAAYVWLSIRPGIGHIEIYTLWVVAFIGLLITLTMKVSIGNGVLRFLGSHVFSIYILQRIPMRLLNWVGFLDAHKYMALILVFALTIPFALAFEKGTDLIIDRFISITSTPKVGRSAS